MNSILIGSSCKNVVLSHTLGSVYKSTQLLDMVGVDSGKEVYVVLVVRSTTKTILNFFILDTQGICSLNSVYFGSDWLEREVYDLFGVFILGRENVRLLTDYGLAINPLLKTVLCSLNLVYIEEGKTVN